MPQKNNPMLNQLPSNYYKDIFACPLTKEFKDLQEKYLHDPIGPNNNHLFYDREFDRQFYTIPRRLGMSFYIGRLPDKTFEDKQNIDALEGSYFTDSHIGDFEYSMDPILSKYKSCF